MIIQITNEDIKKGEQGSCTDCAIAIALQRHFKTDDTYVSGGLDDDTPIIKVNDKQLKISEVDVYNVNSFMDLFDNYFTDDDHIIVDEDCIPKPFNFNVEVNQ
jgi:hypothetical protein